MSEADRLQKLVSAQEKEIGRLRRTMTQVRLAHTEYEVVGDKLCVTVSAIGIDEYGFIEKARTELLGVATAILGHKASPEIVEVFDSVSGEILEGGVNPNQESR